MRHQPHLFIPRPWSAEVLQAGSDHQRHLDRVLRYPEGGAISYTDGAGTFGIGVWNGATVERGDESEVDRIAVDLTMAVAPPRSKERQRFVVEKLQELGVSRLVWIITERGQARAPRSDRSTAWAISALEQSRGAWLMDVTDSRFSDLPNPVVADMAGAPISSTWSELDGATIAVGPEGGFSDSEVTMFSRTVGLGSGVLRTETAAVAAAAAVLLGRS
jgi:16S rRNA (uracil1498-N3)-methyltransferase